jgi:hypothetical protein
MNNTRRFFALMRPLPLNFLNNGHHVFFKGMIHNFVDLKTMELIYNSLGFVLKK